MDLWICCFAGFRRSVVMGLRNWGFASMCLCGFTDVCVSGLAGPRWRAAHRATGGVSSLRAFIADAFAPAVLRAVLASWGSTCGPSPPRWALRPLGYRRTGEAGSAWGLCLRLGPYQVGGAGLLFPSPYHAVLAVKVCACVARWRPGGRLTNPDGCAAPCCFRSRAIPP